MFDFAMALAGEIATTGEFNRVTKLPSVKSPGDSPQALLDAVKSLKAIADAREGISGSILDKSLTMRDLLGAGALQLNIGGHVLGAGGGSAMQFTGTSSSSPAVATVGYVDPRPVLTTPPAPGSLTASGTLRSVFLTWTLLEYQNHSHVEVYRSATNSQSVSALIGSSVANLYIDMGIAPSNTYYYWVRAVGVATDGSLIYGPYNAASGVSGGAQLIGGTDLGPLIIQAGNLANGAVDGNKLAIGAIAVGSAAIQNGAIVNAMIGSLAVDDAKISSLDGGKINALSITAGQIAANAVTANKILANTIGVGQLSATLLNSDNLLTRGMTVRDANGGIILQSGVGMDFNTRFMSGTTGIPANNATVGATWGSGGNVVGSAAVDISIAARLNKSGADTLTGPISLNAASAILVGTTNDGLYLGSTGIIGRKGGATTFSVDQAGNANFGGVLNAATGSFAGSLSAAKGSFSGSLSAATGSFAGELSAATGTFSGALTANAINAVDTINLRGNAVTVPDFSYASGIATTIGSNWITILTSGSINVGSSSVCIMVGLLSTSNYDTSTGTAGNPVGYRITRNDASIASWYGSTTVGDSSYFMSDVPGGTAVYKLQHSLPIGQNDGYTGRRTMLCLGVKR